MDTTRIRPIAICLFRNGNKILVSEGFDAVKRNFYYRPLGGGIEYGETSEAAIRRETREELGLDAANLKLLGVIENIFIYNGEQGHEIVFVFDGEFTDKSLYNSDELDGYEQEADIKFKAKWLSLDEIKKIGRLVPEELLDFIAA